MTTYNTGNPVPSADARDRFDNSQTFDELINGPLGEYLNRLGVPLKSWRGLMQQVTDYLIAQGYESIYLTYGAGVIVERQTQLVQRAGELYRVINATDIPLTLTGTWATDAPKLQAVGDAALRQALINSSDPTLGAALARRAIRHINGLSELRALAGQYNGEIVYLRGRTSALLGLGEGLFIFVAAGITPDDDGVFISAAGGGNWQRIVEGDIIPLEWWGVSAGSDITTALTAAVNVANTYLMTNPTARYKIRLPGTGYYATSPVAGLSAIPLLGDGAFINNMTYPVVQDRRQLLQEVTLPAALSFFPGRIWSNGIAGQAFTNFDVRDYWKVLGVESGVTYYVNSSASGNDANAGTTPDIPLRTYKAALAKVDVGRIVLTPGTYYSDAITYTRNVAVVSQSGKKDVLLRSGVNAASQTWTAESGAGFPNVYSCTIPTGFPVMSVLDSTMVDENGDYFQLMARTSAALVNANPGSFFYDDAGGRKLWVRMPTNRSPALVGGEAVILSNVQNQINGNVSVYMENIRVEGGNRCLYMQATAGPNRPRLFAYNCDYRYGGNVCIGTLGAITYLQNCTICHAGLDNLNYHNGASVGAISVEIGCKSYAAGFNYTVGGPALHEQNGSSNHDNGLSIRINGEYFDNLGPNVIDTGLCVTLNVGTICSASKATISSSDYGPGNNTNFYGGDMTLVDCASRRATSDLVVQTGGIVRIRNLISNDQFVRNSTGVIQQV